MTRLRLRTLGAVGLEGIDAEGQGQILLGAGKPLAALVYLAMAPARTVSRDHLLDLLWQNLEAERARATLRQTVHQLRELVGPDELTGDRRTLKLGASVVCDAEELFSAVRDGNSAKALELYKGPFLPELSFPGGDEFEQWSARERELIEQIWLRSAETFVRTMLDGGRAREALRHARSIRMLAPHRQAVWRLLFEVLRSANDHRGLAIEKEALRRYLAESDTTEEPATRAVLDDQSLVPSVPTSDRPILTSELVGREHQFSFLVDHWNRARQGQAQHIHLVGGMGLGKTRLLSEFAARLRSRGMHVAWVRAHPGDHQLGFGLAADVANALASLSGAIGVSAATARVLVNLSPSLSRSYDVVPDRGQADDVTRQRTLALLELISTVAEEETTAMFVDDLHWADSASRQVLDSIVARLTGRVMIMTASRTVWHEGSAHKCTSLLHLPPLTLGDTEALLHSLGLQASPSAMTELCAVVHATSHGSPYVVLESFQLAMDREFLVREDDRLVAPDPQALGDFLRKTDVIEPRIESCSVEERAALQVLVVASQPVAEGLVARAMGMEEVHGASVLRALAARRLASSHGAQWEVAHDAIAEHMLSRMSTEDVSAHLRSLGRALASRSYHHDDDARAAARYLLRAEATDELASVGRDWLRRQREAGDTRHARDSLRSLLPEGTDAQLDELLQLLPWRARWNVTTARALLATVVLMAAAGTIWSSGPLPQDELRLVAAPLVARDSTDTPLQLFEPAPVVELRDRRNNLVSNLDDTVVVSVVSGTGQIRGEDRAPLSHGRAMFLKTGLSHSGPVRLEFRSLRSQARLAFAFDPGAIKSAPPLQLVEASLNGIHLTGASRDLYVAPREQVKGFVTVEYTSISPVSTVWLAGTHTWGDPEASVQSFGGLSTPAFKRSRTEPLAFTAPSSPGVYYYLLVLAPEPTAGHVMSATNWALSAPRWGDGNDLASSDPQSIELAIRTGRLHARVLKTFEGAVQYKKQEFGATAIRVIVTAQDSGSHSPAAGR